MQMVIGKTARYLLIAVAVFLSVFLINTLYQNQAEAMNNTSSKLLYKLGETSIFLEVYENQSVPANPSQMVYFHPHEDEVTSYVTTKKIVDDIGGKIYSLQHGGSRLIDFVYDGKKYTVDPNRMFKPIGIKASLEKYSKAKVTDEVVDAVYSFALWVSGAISAPRVFAIHNNYNKGYNVDSYLDADGKKAEGVRDIYINPENSTGNFIYTTDVGLFNASKINKFNTVLQDINVEDDGSYSVFAQNHNIDYINVEATRGDAKNDENIIRFVNRFYNVNTPPTPKWENLKKGDIIDLVATSSAYNMADLAYIKKIIEARGYVARDIYAIQNNADKLYYSNTDDQRLALLLKALNDPDSKAVWEIRGGAGTTNLLIKMLKSDPPARAKPIIGFSDTTGLHLLVNNVWNWSSIHGVVAEYNKEVHEEKLERNYLDKQKLKAAERYYSTNKDASIDAIFELLDGTKTEVKYKGLEALNDSAKSLTNLKTTLIGGNLTLVETILGTNLTPKGQRFTLVLEGIGNSLHQLERLLDNIAYGAILKNVDAIVLGEFIQSPTADTHDFKKLTEKVLIRFADKMNIPVFHWNKFGHGLMNNPLPLNTEASIDRQAGLYNLTIKSK